MSYDGSICVHLVRHCTERLAFGGDGQLFKIGCDDYAYFFNEELNFWNKLGTKKVHRITADGAGKPFFIAQKQSNQLFEWYNEK